MEILNTILYFIVTLGVLVFIHELGHFLAAKLFKMRVDVFSLGFPPRAFGKQIGDTDYCVSWIPIGGYVKIAGMIDESFDTEYLKSEPKPWEFRSKPIWQRMIVISAGVIMNVLLAIAIFWGLTYKQGKTVRNTTTIGAVVENSTAAAAGLQKGDRILRINNVSVANWEDVQSAVYTEHIGDDLFFDVERRKQTVRLHVPHDSLAGLIKGKAFGIGPEGMAVFIREVSSGGAAAKLGLQPFDTLLTLNGTILNDEVSVKQIISSHPNIPISIEWRRGDSTFRGTIVPNEKGMIGISYGAEYVGPSTKIEYTLWEALPAGIEATVDNAATTIKGLWALIERRISFGDSVAGPIKIAQIASRAAQHGIETYLFIVAMLSLSLAILNILPIPALDGGHLLILAVEGVAGRELPPKPKLIIQRSGFVLLLLFMLFAVINDIRNF